MMRIMNNNEILPNKEINKKNSNIVYKKQNRYNMDKVLDQLKNNPEVQNFFSDLFKNLKNQNYIKLDNDFYKNLKSSFLKSKLKSLKSKNDNFNNFLKTQENYNPSYNKLNDSPTSLLQSICIK